MTRIAVPAIGTIAASTAEIPAAAAQQLSDGPYMMWSHGWWGMILGPFMMIALIAIIVVAVALLVRGLGGMSHHQSSPPPTGKTPLDILKERFARSEIDKQEFEERRRVVGD